MPPQSGSRSARSHLRLLAALPVVAVVLAAGCAPRDETTATPRPPVAKRIPTELEKHGDVRNDPYYWLRERDNPEVVDYLEAENAYADAMMAHTEPLQEKLFAEIVARIPQRDESVPAFDHGYWYYRRFEEGSDYPLYCRKKGSLEAEEEVYLDANRLAEGHEFFSVQGVAPSPSGKLLAYAADTVGRRLYTLRFRDLTTGEDFPEAIPDVTGNQVWANDDATVFYTRQHPETLRWYRTYRHVVGTDPADDVLVYEEGDEEFNTYLYKTKSDRYVIIASEQTESSEDLVLDADRPAGEFRIFSPREPHHEYSIDHVGDRWIVRTNWEAENFRLMEASEGDTAKPAWREIVPVRDDVYLEAFELFRDHLVLTEREQALTHLRIRRWDGGDDHVVELDEPAYVVWVDENPDPDTTILRYGYESLTTPESIYDYDMETHQSTLRKREEVRGDFSPDDYVTERLWAPARDGVRVPISIVYRKGFEKDGRGPLLLYGYGSYGYSIDPSFASYRLSLLDRGFAFAIAHIRGGQELGREWYEQGRLMQKKNTFTDFIDCGRYLVDQGYTSPEHLYAMGGSAGGLLMGAVTNMAPELFHGVVSHVAYVDVITTMLDPSIPLTTSEYDEWGNPNEKEAYDYMLSYSPYDQLEAKDYPNLLMTTGLHDSQVQYWEPAKYVAKLRSLKTDDNLLLLFTNMEAGHGGASGRLKQHRETARDYAFLLDLEGITE